MDRRWFAFGVALVAGLLAPATPARVHAAPLVLELKGVLDAGTGIDGTAFGSPLGFTLTAMFDSAPISDLGFAALYDTTPKLMIDTVGTLTFAAGVATVLLSDPSFVGFYFAGVVEPRIRYGVLGGYSTANPAFFYTAPIPTIFSDFVAPNQAAGDYLLSDGRILTAFFAADIAATRIIGVPEPATAALVGAGLLGLGLVRRRGCADASVKPVTR